MKIEEIACEGVAHRKLRSTSYCPREGSEEPWKWKSRLESMEEWEAFCEFLICRQPPCSLSECTADDAIEFLLTLPSHRINKVADRLTAVNLQDNPFGSPIVRTYLKLMTGHADGEEHISENTRQDDKVDLFEKCLTTSDVGSLNRLVITPNEDAKTCFILATIVGDLESYLRLEDEEGKPWMFGFSPLEVACQSFVLTRCWRSYVKEKQLDVGDFVFFQRHLTDRRRLFIGCRRRNGGTASRDDAHESSISSALNSTSPETSEFRDKLKEVETHFQPKLSEHSTITGSDSVFVIYCGNNQDSEEIYFISYIFNELRHRGFTPLRYDLTSSLVTGNANMLYRSRVCIIIFSMNYARSRECMDEFVEIMENLNTKNVVIIPVFFKVSFSEVRDQSGSFGEAFTRLGNSVHVAQVLKWRTAMIELSSISRYQYMKGDEVVLAKNVVGDVYLMFKYEMGRKLQGMRSQLDNILSLLKVSQSSAPHIVGLWGMAGIGKTSITGDIFRTQAERYDVCYFQPDFHLICQTKGLSHLREEFFSKIFGEENVFRDACDTKLSFIRDRLLDKRVLIVLDGVSSARDAEAFLGGFGWFSGGHTIIFTSRNRQVLVQCNAKELYEIQKLSKEESLRLCYQVDAEQDWMGKMSELVKYASGIPLALSVLASSVRDQCINDEKNHLRRLRQHPPVEIQDAFRISFDGRDDNEKSIFLDLACFFRGEYKELVVNILDGCGLFTDLGISGLLDESLISLVDNRIVIPNIFQDTARLFVRQENKEVGKRSRLWDSDDIADVLIKKSGTEAIEGIFLDLSGLTFELNPTVFERMYRLRLLKLHCPNSDNHCKVCLPEGLHSLPDELRLLHWERYPLGSLPRNFNPKNLVELNMPYSNLTKLWKGTKNLEKLKRIILSHSRQLTKFPRLSKAKNLEHIDLEGCTSLVKVNSSILHHHKLTFLSLKDCSRLRSMPATVHLEALEILNLSGCSDLEDLQDFSTNLSELYLVGTAITEMSSSIGGLTRLVTLDLQNCNRLQHLPPEIRNLKAVVSLSAKYPASSKASWELYSSEDVAPPYRRFPLKKVIEAVILSLRKRKREKSVSISTNLSEVQLGSASTSVSDLPYKSFWEFFALPERPGQSECIYYMKTGDCKFGNDCKFHHPRDRETHASDVIDSYLSHPSRPGNPVCASYFHTGNCSSGPTCIFDHPSLIPTHMNTSSIGDSSRELVGAATKKPRIHSNTCSTDSETRQLSPLGVSSSIGDSSSELVEAPTLKSPNLSPLGLSSSPGALSSEHVEASPLSDITHATFGIDSNDFWEYNEENFQRWWHPFRNPDL